MPDRAYESLLLDDEDALTKVVRIDGLHEELVNMMHNLEQSLGSHHFPADDGSTPS